MTGYPNETVQAAANRLMNALALHEDARGTVTDLLHDMWDAGRDTTAALALAPARLIHDDARALVNRSAVLTRTAHLRILANTDKLLDVLGEKSGTEDDNPRAPYLDGHDGSQD